MTKLWEVSDETSTDRFPHFQCLTLSSVTHVDSQSSAQGLGFCAKADLVYISDYFTFSERSTVCGLVSRCSEVDGPSSAVQRVPKDSDVLAPTASSSRHHTRAVLRARSRSLRRPSQTMNSFRPPPDLHQAFDTTGARARAFFVGTAHCCVRRAGRRGASLGTRRPG